MTQTSAADFPRYFHVSARVFKSLPFPTYSANFIVEVHEPFAVMRQQSKAVDGDDVTLDVAATLCAQDAAEDAAAARCGIRSPDTAEAGEALRYDLTDLQAELSSRLQVREGMGAAVWLISEQSGGVRGL